MRRLVRRWYEVIVVERSACFYCHRVVEKFVVFRSRTFGFLYIITWRLKVCIKCVQHRIVRKTPEYTLLFQFVFRNIFWKSTIHYSIFYEHINNSLFKAVRNLPTYSRFTDRKYCSTIFIYQLPTQNWKIKASSLQICLRTYWKVSYVIFFLLFLFFFEN